MTKFIHIYINISACTIKYTFEILTYVLITNGLKDNSKTYCKTIYVHTMYICICTPEYLGEPGGINFYAV